MKNEEKRKLLEARLMRQDFAGRVLVRGKAMPDDTAPEDEDAADPFKPTKEELALINQYTLRKFAASELWTCDILACDNQPDRHGERLLPAALQQLSTTYPGRTQGKDHWWLADNQNARIYAASVVADPNQASAIKGEPYTCLVFKIFMVRNASNKDQRTNIEAGVTKETSVGFMLDWLAVECSICGGAIYDWMGKCSHMPLRDYEGELCIAEIPAHDDLEGLENSWVAVPAQPKAGAMRAAKGVDQDAARKDLLERKEKAMKQRNALLDKIKAAPGLKELLDDGEQSELGGLLWKLVEDYDAEEDAGEEGKSTVPAQEVAKVTAQSLDISKLVAETAEKGAAAIAAQLPELVNAAVKSATEALHQEIAELKATVTAKVATATIPPLATGFELGEKSQSNGRVQAESERPMAPAYMRNLTL